MQYEQVDLDKKRELEHQKEKHRQKKQLGKRTLLAAFLIVVMIPLTIFLGIKIGDRQYYFISLLIIIYTMIPFFMVFEARKPQAREIVVIAVLSGIAVAGRAAFFWLPQFKPLVAVVIVAAVTFGPESGFLCGAVSGFVSNFFFGQGPWSPWQMFAFGIVGFLAGILFKKGWLPKKTLPLSIYGLLSTFFICGPILDTCTLFTMASVVNKEQALLIYASGVPMNAIHAIATFLFLLIIAKPMIEKLDRIKVKYGMLEP